MDVLRFLRSEKASEMQGILGRSVKEMEAINENVMAITDKTKVIEAIKCMKHSFLNAVPIVRSTQLGGDQISHAQLFTVCQTLLRPRFIIYFEHFIISFDLVPMIS